MQTVVLVAVAAVVVVLAAAVPLVLTRRRRRTVLLDDSTALLRARLDALRGRAAGARQGEEVTELLDSAEAALASARRSGSSRAVLDVQPLLDRAAAALDRSGA